MLNDFINLTQGQLLVKYWWIWLSITVGVLSFVFWYRYTINKSLRLLAKKQRNTCKGKRVTKKSYVDNRRV